MEIHGLKAIGWEDCMKKVLITGGTVFVSRYIAEYYVKKHYDVYVLNRNSKKQSKGIKLIQADRHNLGNLLRDFHFDVVIDTAYTSDDVEKLLAALDSYEDYILISSSAVYPENLSQPFKEDSPVGVNNYWGKYGIDKIEASEKVYLQCLSAIKQLSLTEYSVVYNNLTWINLLWGKYDKVLQYANEAEKHSKTHEMMYFYKSYAYHKMNMRNEAKEQIRQAKLYCTKSSEYRIAMIDAFATYLYETKPFELKEKKFLKAYKSARKANDIQAAIFVLNLLSDLCESYMRKEKELFYKTEMIKLYKMRR